MRSENGCSNLDDLRQASVDPLLAWGPERDMLGICPTTPPQTRNALITMNYRQEFLKEKKNSLLN